MLKAVFEPVIFRFETDQHARWLAVPGDDDLLRLRLAKEARQIVFDFGQGTSFIPNLRTLRAMTRPPIWGWWY